MEEETSTMMVGLLYVVNEMTIRFFKNNEDMIRGSVKASAQSSVKISCVSCCNPFLPVYPLTVPPTAYKNGVRKGDSRPLGLSSCNLLSDIFNGMN